MSPPIPDYNIHLFIGWLLQRNLSSDTINSYLSAIRQLYIKEGLDPSHIRSELIKQIIKGRSHQTLSTTTSGGSKPRLPVTPAVLRLMKEDIRTSDFEGGKKVLLWSVCTIAFAGAFRVHELLARNHAKFNPLDTLLGKDIKLSKCTLNAKTVTFLQITIKQEKTNSSKSPSIIDVFEAPGQICPVSAFQKLQLSSTPPQDNLPAFRLPNGRAFTGRDLNNYLAIFTKKFFPEANGKFTSHSFRIGLASVLGKLGHTDQEVQAAGRWSSRAHEAYLRLPRTKRFNVAREIGLLST